MTMHVDYPYHIDLQHGRSAKTSDAGYIRDLIEQVLFTSPGERVNRPTFGSGVMQLVFSPNGAVLAAATQVTVQSALQQWLGDLIEVGAVQVVSDDSTLRVQVNYTIRKSQERQTTEFERTI